MSGWEKTRVGIARVGNVWVGKVQVGIVRWEKSGWDLSRWELSGHSVNKAFKIYYYGKKDYLNRL